MNNKKKCFVIMPFSKAYSLTKEQWTEVFTHTIKPAVEDCGLGYECERYEFRRANIIKDILQEINSANIVIADLTGSNPNVLWELGVRHTLSKRTILIAQDKRFLPSDLQDYPIITYKYQQTPTEVSKFKQEISDKLKDIEADPEKSDSPVADFLQLKNIDILTYEKSSNLKKISALISELSYNIDKTDVILNHLNTAQEERKKEEKKRFFSAARLCNTSLELLLTTQYISLPQQMSEFSYVVNQIIALINRNLDMRLEFGDVIDKRLIEILSSTRKDFINLLIYIRQIRTNYASDNYQEPKEPVILLARPEHEEYLKLKELE